MDKPSPSPRRYRLSLRPHSVNGLLWRLVLAAALVARGVGWYLASSPAAQRAQQADLELLEPGPKAAPLLTAAAAKMNDAMANLALAEIKLDPNSVQASNLATVPAGLDGQAQRVWNVRRAIVTTATAEDPEQQHRALRLAFAQAAVQADPDNALGWYSLAAAELQRGDRSASFAALAKGNRAARLDSYDGVLRAARQRLLTSAASSIPSWFVMASRATGFENLAAWRSLARAGAKDATDPERMEIAAFGARLVNESASNIAALVGAAVETYGIGEVVPQPACGGDTAEVYAWRAQNVRAFVDRLRDQGLTSQADWLAHQSAREATAWREVARRPAPYGAYLSAAHGFGTWAAGLGLAAGLVLLLAALWVERATPGRPWTLVELSGVWRVVLPVTILSTLVAVFGARYLAAWAYNGDPPEWLVAFGSYGLTALPVVAIALVLLLTPRLSEPQHGLRPRGVLLPTAALCLLLASLALPATLLWVGKLARATGPQSPPETYAVHQEMDRVGPALPVTWPAPDSK